jgi:hypothetical protein
MRPSCTAEKGDLLSDNYTKRAAVNAADEFIEEDHEYGDASDVNLDFLDEENETMSASLSDDYGDDDEGPYPCWQGETLHVPPFWRGQLSEIDFSSREQPEGTMVVAEIPGETTSVITALCTDGEGLMDICFGIDAAVSVASEPQMVPREFLAEHSMQLYLATAIFKEAARRMDESMDEAFCPPDRTVEFKAQLSANQQGARSLRTAAKRVEDAIAGSASPLLNAASREPAGMRRIH